MIPIKDLPHDEVLTQLALAQDRSAMRDIFQKRLFDPDSGKTIFQIKDCQILQIRYKPRKNCLICYRLTIHDPLANQDGVQLLYARIFEKGGSLSRFIKAQTQPLTTPKYGRPLYYILELEMVVWAFPNDRKLHGLSRIIDPLCLKEEILPDVIWANFGHGWKISGLTHEVVHYVAEHTCTIRVDLELQNTQTGKGISHVLYGKTYYNEEGAETYRVMLQLWKTNRNGQLGMARPLGYEPRFKTLWQLGLKGSTLLEEDMNSPLFLTLLREAASNIAALHRSTASCSRSVEVKDLLTKLREVELVLSTAKPSFRQTLNSLIARLILQSEHLEPRAIALLHGDLHLQNFLVDSGKIALIDMDNTCKGNPLQDIGSFIANLKYMGILNGISDPVIRQMSEVFIGEYEKNVPWTVPRSVLDWHISMALINERAFRCLTRLKAGRLDILGNIIDLANKVSLNNPD